jgi:hypothetical protein
MTGGGGGGGGVRLGVGGRKYVCEGGKYPGGGGGGVTNCGGELLGRVKVNAVGLSNGGTEGGE